MGLTLRGGQLGGLTRKVLRYHDGEIINMANLARADLR